MSHKTKASGPSRLPFGPKLTVGLFFWPLPGLPKDQQQSVANYIIFFFFGGGELLCCQLFFYARCRYHEHLESIGAHLTAVFCCVLQGSLMLLADLDLINWRFRWFRCVWSVWIFWKLREISGEMCTVLKWGLNSFWNFRRIFSEFIRFF